MDEQELIRIAQRLIAGELTPTKFAEEVSLGSQPQVVELSSASLDLDRRRRCGYPEVVYGESKSCATLAEIFSTLLAARENVLATRISADKAVHLLNQFPDARYNELARTLRLDARASREAEETQSRQPQVAIITAGTSDLGVAEEARETLDWMGVAVNMIHDVGVAGPHRLPARLADFQDVDAIVVVAGMEGALPSIVGGYVGCPVIAVPTSVGYGANLGGIAALLSMLNSCASNVAVVNIDAGFKGAYLAGLIACRRVEDG